MISINRGVRRFKTLADFQRWEMLMNSFYGDGRLEILESEFTEDILLVNFVVI